MYMQNQKYFIVKNEYMWGVLIWDILLFEYKYMYIILF